MSENLTGGFFDSHCI